MPHHVLYTRHAMRIQAYHVNAYASCAIYYNVYNTSCINDYICGGGLAQLAATLSLRPYGPEFEPPPHLPHARYVPLLPLVIKQETLN